MNAYKSISSVCQLLFLLAFSTGSCFADSINSSQTLTPGTSLDLLDLEALGIDPASFLFTRNTMYDFTGDYELSIVSALIDPSHTSSLNGAAVQITNIVLGTSDDSSDTSSPIPSTTDAPQVPEPVSLFLAALAFGCLLWFDVGRFRQSVMKPDKLVNR